MRRASPIVICFSLAALCILSCTPLRTETAAVELRKIEEVIGNPEHFLNTRVRVRGYMTLEFENLNVWVNHSAQRRHDCRRAIGLHEDNNTAARALNRSNVEIVGVVSPLCGEATFNDPDLICISTGHCGKIFLDIETVRRLR